MDSKASAVWKGDLKGGNGTISANSGVLSDAAYTFATRFEGSAGTNPEELIAAAHAGCFSMALSAQLGEAAFGVRGLLEKVGFTVDALQLKLPLTGGVPDTSLARKPAAG